MMLKADDVSRDETTGQWTAAIYADKDAGKTLKTIGSARTIPIHAELVRVGFPELHDHGGDACFEATA